MEMQIFRESRKEWIILGVVSFLIFLSVFFSLRSKIVRNIRAGKRINLLVLVCGGTLQSGKSKQADIPADVIIWLSYHPVRRFLDVFSIPHNTKTRNYPLDAHRIGDIYVRAYEETNNREKASNFLREEIEKILKIRIPFYIQIDYKEFIEIIDLLKGIRVVVSSEMKGCDDFKSGLPKQSTAGEEYILTGKETLEYISFQGNKGNYGGILRQQKVLKKIIEKFKEPLFLLKIPQIFRRSILSNLTFWDIMAVAYETNKFPQKNIRLQILPGKKQNKSGDYWILDRKRIKQAVELILSSGKEEDISLSGPVTVAVWNASDIKGMARQIKAKLSIHRMDVVDWGNYNTKEESTVVIDKVGNFQLAWKIAKIINCSEIVTEIGDFPLQDISIIIGEDYNQLIKRPNSAP